MHTSRFLNALCRQGAIVRYRCCEAASQKGKITPTPVFEFAASHTVCGHIILVGDAAQLGRTPLCLMLRPSYVGFVGCVCGETNIDNALKTYDKEGTRRANALYSRSHTLSRMRIPKQGKHATKYRATLVGWGSIAWPSLER